MKKKSEVRSQSSEIAPRPSPLAVLAVVFDQIKVGDLWKWRGQCPHCPFQVVHFHCANTERVLDLHLKLRHS